MAAAGVPSTVFIPPSHEPQRSTHPPHKTPNRQTHHACLNNDTLEAEDLHENSNRSMGDLGQQDLVAGPTTIQYAAQGTPPHSSSDTSERFPSAVNQISGDASDEHIAESNHPRVDLERPSVQNDRRQQHRDFQQDPADQSDVITNMTYRSKKRGKSGPDSCLMPMSDTAIMRAIKTAATEEVTEVFFPHKGTVFSSFEEAREFYNLYSWEVGFGIRESRSKKNSNGYITRKDIVCACQGLCENPRAASARTGCKAMIRLHRTENHSWIITSAVTEHNHKMSATCGQKKQWGSHGGLDAVTKEFIRKLRRNNVAIGRVCSIIGVDSDDSLCPIRKEAVRNLCAKAAQEEIEDDIKKTVEFLKKMQQNDDC